MMMKLRNKKMMMIAGYVLILFSNAQADLKSYQTGLKSPEALGKYLKNEIIIKSYLNDMNRRFRSNIADLEGVNKLFQKENLTDSDLSEFDFIDEAKEIEKYQKMLKLKTDQKKLLLKINIFKKKTGRLSHLVQQKASHLYKLNIKRNFVIDNLEDFKIEKKSPLLKYFIPNTLSDFKLSLQNDTEEKGSTPLHFNNNKNEIDGRISCNKNIDVIKKFEINDTKTKRATFTIRKGWFSNPEIKFPNTGIKCKLYFKRLEDKEYQNGIEIMSDSFLNHSELLTNSLVDFCSYDPSLKDSNKSILHNFLGMNYSSVGCIKNKIDDFQFLPDSNDSIIKKMNILTGGPFPKKVIEDVDLAYELDFSNAPKFKMIYLSYLEFKSDFFGNMISRAIKYHADQGTIVRIMVPQAPILPVLKEKDEALLKSLTRYNSNIQFQKFRYRQKNKGFPGLVNSFQRTLHSKIFVTLSDSPEHHYLITGGRNIKDTFVFKKTPDYSKASEKITRYGGESGEAYAYMEDLEILIQSKSLALQVFSQLHSFWNRDTYNMHFYPTSIHIPQRKRSPEDLKKLIKKMTEGTFVRHIFSVPYADHYELEDLYISMINSSEESIKLVTPYFKLRKNISEAILDAANRGVKVQIVTTLDLTGDNVPALQVEINKDTVNKVYKNVDVYSWTKSSILHSKAMLIDNKLLYVGGVNMNERSFTHDVENGVLVTGKKAADQFDGIFKGQYLKGSRLIKEKQTVKFYNKILIKILGRYF